MDLRIIAATNRDLAEEVRSGRFRADLYHRLSVCPLQVPALRERGRDVLLLAGYFLEENRVRLNSEAQRLLLGHHWPGNVRELEQLISRAVLKTVSAHPQGTRVLSIDAQALGLHGPVSGTPTPASAVASIDLAQGQGLKASVDAYQRVIISECLARHNGRWTQVVRELAVDRANLSRLAKRLGIRG